MYILHKKFCKRVMFPGYYNIFHIHLAKYKRRYYKLKMSCVRVHYANLLSVNLRELEVLSAKCRGGQRSPSVIRRREGIKPKSGFHNGNFPYCYPYLSMQSWYKRLRTGRFECKVCCTRTVLQVYQNYCLTLTSWQFLSNEILWCSDIVLIWSPMAIL